MLQSRVRSVSYTEPTVSASHKQNPRSQLTRQSLHRLRNDNTLQPLRLLRLLPRPKVAKRCTRQPTEPLRRARLRVYRAVTGSVDVGLCVGLAADVVFVQEIVSRTVRGVAVGGGCGGLVSCHGRYGDVSEWAEFLKLVVVGRVDLVRCFRLWRPACV